MEEYLADLHGCINCLGSLDNNKFLKDVDTIVSLRDILRHLRRETEKCEIRIELGKFKVVEKCFLSLLKSYHDDSVLFDLLIRLLMNLTQPSFICFKQTIPEDSDAMEIYLEVDEILQKYKSFFADKSFLEVLSTKLSEIYNKDWEDRSEDDHLMVERILILMRNILHINTSKSDNIITHGIRSKHDDLIIAMLNSGWKEILIYLSNTEEEHRFAFHTLEIISLMFREQSVEFMIKSKAAHSLDFISQRQLVKQQTIELQEKSDNPRAYRYGGTFELKGIKSLSGRPTIYHHDVSSGKINLNQDRKMRGKAKNRLPNKEEAYSHKSTDDVLKALQEFCELFLQIGYNILMRNALSSLQRQQMQPDDETYYLWALRFFMGVCRLNRYNPEYVSETLNTEVFHWVYQQAIAYLENATGDKTTAKASFRKLHLAVSSFKELLEFCLMLDHRKEDKYRKLSASIKSRAFYNEEYIEIFPILIIKFNVFKQSRACLRELIEGSYLVMKLLTDHQNFGMKFVRKLKKKRAKRKSNKTSKEDVPVVEMPDDDVKVLERIWEEIFESVQKGVKDEIELPTDLPRIFDGEPGTREPIEPGSDPVDSQLKRALGIIQIRLRQKKSLEAVALFRLCQTLWPEEDRIMTGEDDDDSVENTLKILKDIMFAAKFYRVEDLAVKPSNIEEQNSNSSEIENEEDEINMQAHEVAFDFDKFILKFCHPNIVSAYGIIFSDYLTNPKSTNRRLLSIMHKIAVESKKPFVLYQLKLFNGFNKFLQDPVSKLDEFKEFHEFIIKIMRKFFEHVSQNRKLLLEILFSKSYNEAYVSVNGENDSDDCSNQKLWPDELEAELVRLYEEVQHEEIAPGCDKASVIQYRFSDKTKTRRQIINRMVTLGLIKSAKELKNKKRNTIPWSSAEENRLIILFEDSRDQPNPIREIMNGLKATAEDPENVRSRQMVVKKILEMKLVDSKEKLGIRPKTNKPKIPNDSDSEDDEDENENENNEYDDNDEESKFMNEIFQKTMSSAIKRNPPPPKIRRIIDWTALKTTYAHLNNNERQWFVDLLVDNIDSRANGIVGHLTIVPIEEYESVILENKLVQNLLYICNFLYPDPSEGFSFWRIPENMTANELDNFRHCVTSLSEDEMQALTSTDLDSQELSISLTNTLNDVESRNRLDGSVKRKKSQKTLNNSDSEETETYSDSVSREKENSFSSKKKKSLRLLLSENEEESEQSVSDNEPMEIPSSMKKKKSLKLLESDDDDEEEEDNQLSSNSNNKMLISDDDNKENVSASRQRKSLQMFESDEEDEERVIRRDKINKRAIIESDDEDDGGEIESTQVKRIKISEEDD